MTNQIKLPQSIYTIYDFFNKTKNKDWKENPFVFYNKINNIDIKIAKNISNLNFYQADIPISKKINPDYLIKYLKNIDYRNYYAKKTLFYKLVSQINNNEWIENEYYKDSKNCFTVHVSQFTILFYNKTYTFEQNLSDTKYYHSFKILDDNDKYILRFEIVLSNMDIDQEIDIIIYLNMLIRLLRAVYLKFKINFDLISIKKNNSDADYFSDSSHNISSTYNSETDSDISKEDKHVLPIISTIKNDYKPCKPTPPTDSDIFTISGTKKT